MCLLASVRSLSPTPYVLASARGLSTTPSLRTLCASTYLLLHIYVRLDTCIVHEVWRLFRQNVGIQ
jgi:hypothetical protein